MGNITFLFKSKVCAIAKTIGVKISASSALTKLNLHSLTSDIYYKQIKHSVAS